MTERIQFVGMTKVYEVELTQSYKDTLKINFLNNKPSKSTILLGFYILSTNDKICGRYDNYNYLYADSSVCSQLSDSEFIVTFRSNYVYQSATPTQIDPQTPIVIIPTLQEVKSQKITELSNTCNQLIEYGVDVLINGNTEHFSYKIEDQIRLKALFDESLKKEYLPWHSDNSECKLYTQNDIATIYLTEQTNLLRNTTYFNLMKSYINSFSSEDDIEIINAITYGTELIGVYRDKFNLIMESSGVV